MANRCPDCNKFVAIEPGEPEVEFTITGSDIEATVRMTLNCTECGAELRSYTDEMTESCVSSLDAHDTEECELEVVEGDVEHLEDNSKRRTTYGVRVAYEVKCACKPEPLHEGSLESSMVTSAEMNEEA